MEVFVKLYLSILLVSFFLVIFVLRSYLQYRSTGISPFVLKKDLGDPLGEYIGTWFKIVFSLGAVLEAGIITGWFPVWQSNYIVKGIGVLFTFGAFLLMAYAQKNLADSWHIGIDKASQTGLVTNGLYRYSRNPFFTGMLIFLAGLFFLTPTIHGIYLFGFSCSIINVQIRLEETHLLASHGEAYRIYMKRVGRFFPKSK